MLRSISFVATLILLVICASGQTIVDPCFGSIEPLGKFHDSADIINMCDCPNTFIASDLLEWNGHEWEGRLSNRINRPPPAQCSARALWLGDESWTVNGEAFGLRLDKPLKKGETYTFTFTYAKNGNQDYDSSLVFEPEISTAASPPMLWRSSKVGSLPGTTEWKTQSITFKASEQQVGHEWIVVHTRAVSGMILSNCSIDNAIAQNPIAKDTVMCYGNSLMLMTPANPHYSYTWNTGETTPSKVVDRPGLFTVEIKNYTCISKDSIQVEYEDCELRLVMPNVFTPNGDQYNPIFKPIEANYVASGRIAIYNLWGQRIFAGDLFDGWNGVDSSTGVYFFEVYFEDKRGIAHFQRGPVTLMR